MMARRSGRPRRLRLRSSGGGDLEAADLKLLAAGNFAGVWGRVVRAFKEDADPMATGVVRPRLRALLRREAGRWRAAGEPDPVLVPIPMAAVRRRQRGFNPPEVLAEGLAREFGWPCRSRALRRVRYRRPLRGLSAAERRREMEGAFAVDDRLDLEGRAAILIDDVVTTGSTLREAARTLRSAGVPVTRAFCLARTPRRRASRPASRVFES